MESKIKSKIKFLIVEGEQVCLDLYETMITKKFDAKVYKTDNAKNAIKRAKEYRPDVVLLADNMKDGKDTLNTIKGIIKSNINVKFILLSSRFDLDTDTELFKVPNIIDILRKPFAPLALEISINKALSEDLNKGYQTKKLIHTICTQLSNLKLKLEVFTLKHGNPKNTRAYLKEVVQEAIDLANGSTVEIDEICKEVGEIKASK